MSSSRSSSPVTPHPLRLFSLSRPAGQKPGRAPLLAALAALVFCLAPLILAGPAPAWAMSIPGASPSNHFTIRPDGTAVDDTGAVNPSDISSGIDVLGRSGLGGVDGAPMTVTVQSGATFGDFNSAIFTAGTAGANAGGDLDVRLSDRTTFANTLGLHGGNAAMQTAPGGDLRLNDANSAGPSVTTLLQNLNMLAGPGGAIAGAHGGDTALTLAGTLRFAGSVPQTLNVSRNTNNTAGPAPRRWTSARWKWPRTG